MRRGEEPMSQSQPKIRYGVIGLGNIAQVAVLPAFQHASENSELVALISSDAEKRKALQEQWEVKHGGTYEEMERVLDEAGADAVYIALPNSMHRSFTERAARRRLHVLCEIPMATSVADCESMIEVCRENEVQLMIAYRLHFEAGTLSAIEAIADGEIGEPLSFDATYTNCVRPGDIRTRGDLGGGALFDLGVYCVNAARNIFQDEPVEVLGWQQRQDRGSGVDIDTLTTAMLKFPGDKIATFTCGQSAGEVDCFRVVGTDGDLRVEPAFTYHDSIHHHFTVEEKTRRKRFSKRDQFAAELVYFSECVARGIAPEPDGEEGLADVRVMQAIVGSAKEHDWIELEPFERFRRPRLTQAIEKPPVRRQKTIRAPSPTL
jgi:predicted dehydrogenase